MIRKIVITLLFTLILSGSFVFASPILGGKYTEGNVILSGQPVSFSPAPFILNGEIMVPAKSFSEKIGAQVIWNESTGEVISYRDNIYIKYKPGSATAQVNGKAKTLPVRSILYKGELFIPASFAVKSHELNHTIDGTIININYKENVPEYQQFGFRHFKRISLANWGISFYIPEYWEAVGDGFNVYGVDNTFESYKLSVELIPDKTYNSRSVMTNAITEDLFATYGDNLTILSTSTVQMGDYTSDVIEYELTNSVTKIHHVKYLFFEQGIGYVLTGETPSTSDLAESREIFELISGTFSIIKLTVNEKLEHYSEYNKFFEYGVNLTRIAHSNMTVSNQFILSGTVENAPSGASVVVTVTKDLKSRTTVIPLTDNAFSGVIYTPFGLGKHNVSMYITTDEINNTGQAILNADIIGALLLSYDKGLDLLTQQLLLQEQLPEENDLVLKFSALNISSEDIQYLLPSSFINYDLQALYGLSTAATFNLSNQYSKAKALYEWMLSEYTLISDRPIVTIRPVDQLITNTTELNEVELNFLYTGLLRSVDIPARVMRGVTEAGVDYWVELMINGRWFIAAPALEMNQLPELPEYFGIDLNDLYPNYGIIEEVDL